MEPILVDHLISQWILTYQKDNKEIHERYTSKSKVNKRINFFLRKGFKYQLEVELLENNKITKVKVRI